MQPCALLCQNRGKGASTPITLTAQCFHPRGLPMLDALKNMTGAKGKLVQQQTSELETLIATAREERAAISAMLTALTTRSAKLVPLGKSLEQVTDKASAATARGCRPCGGEGRAARVHAAGIAQHAADSAARARARRADRAEHPSVAGHWKERGREEDGVRIRNQERAGAGLKTCATALLNQPRRDLVRGPIDGQPRAGDEAAVRQPRVPCLE